MQGIFINYRRQDSSGYADRIYDHLVAHFGKEKVFMDIDTISPGDDFLEIIEKTCLCCGVFLVLIGKTWLTGTDDIGRRRLDDPNDLVRLEITRGLDGGMPIIPVLLEETEMPGPDALPDSLRKLAFRQALHVSRGQRFPHDIRVLIEAVKHALAKNEPNAGSEEPDIGRQFKASEAQASPTASSFEIGLAGATPALERRPPSGLSALAKATRQKVKILAVAIIAAAVVATASLGIRGWIESANRPLISPLNLKLDKVTETGRVSQAAISRDGRYIAYVEEDGDNQSLHVKQGATNADVEVVAASPGVYGCPTFTPDGSYVFYLYQERKSGRPMGGIYSVPSLGGRPRRVIEKASSAVTFSSDGLRIAFMRYDDQTRKAQLITAATDGSDERVLRSDEDPSAGAFLFAPAWSADGKFLATGEFGKVVVVTPAGKVTAALSIADGIYRALAWSPDDRGLFVAKTVPVGNGFLSRGQIFFQPYPRGEVLRLTNDGDSYTFPEGGGPGVALSITADGETLATMRQQVIGNILVGAMRRDSLDPVLQPAISGEVVGSWLSWTRDGRLLTGNLGSAAYVVASDGRNRSPITQLGSRAIGGVGCGSADVVILNVLPAKSESWTAQLFRVDLAGEETRRLGDGSVGELGNCTPDGHWVLYTVEDRQGMQIRTTHLMKVPVEGGTAIELGKIPGGTSAPLASPDGRLLAYIATNPAKHTAEFAIQGIAGGSVLYTLRHALHPTQSWPDIFAWMPDSKALLVAQHVGGSDELFRVPLDGSRPVQLTHFGSEPLVIMSVAVSPDGRKLAVAVQRSIRDAVLLTNFRNAR